VDVYRAYEKVCAEAGLVDFAELLLRTYELLSADPALGDHYRNRFKVILVDEFQDTNAIQYLWLKALVTPATGLFVVGDDDQSIYGWRGACADNIHRVAKEFAPVKICRLEQNYRSTEAILNAANTLIAHNQGRMEKKLWTDQAGGEEIVCHQTFNDRDEAFYVGSKIMAYLEQGGQRSDIAILYRSNAQSRLFEEELLRMGIPYRVYGGQRFFERAEIKDALGYLRLVENRADDPSFERIVNLPTRGIGDQTLQVVRQLARLHGVTLWQAMMLAIEQKQPNGRASEALRRFAHLIDQMDHATAALAPAERCQEVIRLSGLREHFSREKGEKGRNRLENLDELINAVRAWELEWDEQGAMFVPDADAVSLNAGQSSPVADMADMAAMADVDAPGQPGQEMSELAVSRSSSHPPERGALLPLFLSQAVLESGEEGDGQVEESVQMMTLHSAKGLEFPMVFLVGLEQGLFPNRMAIDENRLDEERRLCYVGMTRACEHLICTFAGQRMVYGRIQESAPSQFLYESGLYSPDQYRQGVQHYRHADWNEGAARTPGGGESRGGRHSGAGSRGFEGPSGYGSASRSSYGASQSSGQGFGGRAMAGASMSNRAWDASGGSSASIAKKWGASETGLMLGQSVVHAKFGDGVVMSLEGSGAHARVQVAFERSGTKWLMLAYANLQPR
jgi:DNA helicase-2/ATP-dependent DNA helicase PcrA